VLSSKTSSNDPDEKRQEISERDVPGTPSLSKNRAISALSQPTTETDASPPNEKDKNGSGSVSNRRRRLGSRRINTKGINSNLTRTSLSTRIGGSSDNNRRRISKQDAGKNPTANTKASAERIQHGASSREGLSGRRSSVKKRQKQYSNKRKQSPSSNNNSSSSSYSSLLPPPLTSSIQDKNDNADIDNGLTSGLSSWEEFLGGGLAGGGGSSPEDGSSGSPLLPRSTITTTTTGRTGDSKGQSQPNGDPSFLKGKESNSQSDNTYDKQQEKLPSIQDLFPPDLSSQPLSSSPSSKSKQRKSRYSSIDGVLPVSDLFYRSSQLEEVHDDEELPFSTEQSGTLVSDNNKINIRRNLARQRVSTNGKQEAPRANSGRNGGKRGKRKMVRRGMEMLVGGVPINADPPQRSLELGYNSTAQDWASVISLNTFQFGPLLDANSISKVSDIERGLFCEYFYQSALKWDIASSDMRDIVKSHSCRRIQPQKRERKKNKKNLDEKLESSSKMFNSMDNAETNHAGEQRKLSDDLGNKLPNEKVGRQKEEGNEFLPTGKANSTAAKYRELCEVNLNGDGPSKPVAMGNDDIFLDGGNGGVFCDYSEQNSRNAPYRGEIGLRLVDAALERAKQNHARVIVIGDVHGCIDELQDLLRQCDYKPGDIVLFLGDLVCKGPDSLSVVQMAREIGAIGIRGNHDYEVIRWNQAIKFGVDPPVVGSEHFHIASSLSKEDMKWMYSLPWYISSWELSTLFVHAGFVSGIRLSKQNPRLMMNMRSILPDGTVTSKFFNNWPWARLWDGPQTVLFGHDADRGLQQYEHAIGLDTGCVYGGRLTACILPEKRLVSVSARREYL